MNNQFSENLKKIRRDHNMSQEQLADELGVSRQAISKWESSNAYPEMDKIIALCDKFDLNIDDLLHRDIREIKREEESKKTLNKAFDDFLKFITDTINLFSNMSFKSKIKCLFEQIVIICILMGINFFILQIGSIVLFNLLQYFPFSIRHFTTVFITSILGLFCLIFSIIILVHVFKIRYLDYYDKLKKNLNEDKNIEINKVSKQNKILFNSNKDKIIIRDPKHSDYRFINGLFKFIVGIAKLFVIFLIGITCLVLAGLFLTLILSFLICKTGLFFIGILLIIISSIVITIVMLLLFLNFVFNRKSEKKMMIWSFILSVAILGSGLGICSVGSLNFKFMNYDEENLRVTSISIPMRDNLFIMGYDVAYVETNDSNIKLEYKINKAYELVYNYSDITGMHLYVNCNNPMQLIKQFIENVNNKKIIIDDGEITDIIVYTTKENIAKIKENKQNYYIKQKEYNNLSKYYENKINDLENEVSLYERKVEELLEKLAEYEPN